jgi:hypothetical protein
VGYFVSFHAEVVKRKALMLFVVVKALGCQHDGEDGNFGVELHAYQTTDYCISHKFVSVNAAVDDESAGDDSGVFAGPGELLGL